MSLIIADTFKDEILILADTKMNFDSNFDLKEKDKEEKLIKETVKKYGCIKTYYINKNICISFAGNWKYMSLLMEWLFNRQPFSLNELINKAIELNIQSNNETDYIIALTEENVKGKVIIKIQDGIPTIMSTAWIGDLDAFKMYQAEKLKLEKILSEMKTIKEVDEYCFKLTTSQKKCGAGILLFAELLPHRISDDLEYCKWYNARNIAFLQVVESSEIKTVGKFITKILTNEKHVFFRGAKYMSVAKHSNILNDIGKKV